MAVNLACSFLLDGKRAEPTGENGDGILKQHAYRRFFLPPPPDWLKQSLVNQRAWTKSQIVALVAGAAAALLLIVAAGGLLVYVRLRPSEKLTPMRFDLSNRVQVDNHPQLQFGTGPFAISFWFKTTSQQKYLTFISKRVSTMGDGWVIHGQENNTFLFYTAGCASPTSSPLQFRDGQWHHLALVREGQKLTMFFDNTPVGSGPDPCNHNDTNPIRIGMDAQTGWHFDGEIAEVHFYGRALNPSEIAEEWNEGKGRKTAVAGGGLVAGFHFNEPGGVALDFTGNGHRGLVVRGPAEPVPN